MLQNEFKLKTWPSYKMAIRYKQGPSLHLMDDLSDPGPLFGKWIFLIRCVPLCSRSLPPKKRI